jgi:GAF domain-containing protein
MHDSEISAAEALYLLDLAEMSYRTPNLPELAETFLRGLARLIQAPAAVLYLEDPALAGDSFFQMGLLPEAVPIVRRQCAAQFHPEPGKANLQPVLVPLGPAANTYLHLSSLHSPKQVLGLVGLGLPEHGLPTARMLVDKALPLMTHCLRQMIDRLDYEKQISNLNIYLNVSSMIAQALDLRDALEAVLYFCMEAVAAEAASVLLLDYEKKNFRFYSAEGPTKPVLLTASFPADQGLAGHVLETQQSEVINDVQNDPRFYGKFDGESGFCTRNMIVIPLTAGEEKIGVLEVLNKVGGEPFYEGERLMLHNIAEEIAFAIRNGKMFEVVVKSYCKQRQGLNTCKGCKRPLGSWTPCVKYREASIEV